MGGRRGEGVNCRRALRCREYHELEGINSESSCPYSIRTAVRRKHRHHSSDTCAENPIAEENLEQISFAPYTPRCPTLATSPCLTIPAGLHTLPLSPPNSHLRHPRPQTPQPRNQLRTLRPTQPRGQNDHQTEKHIDPDDRFRAAYGFGVGLGAFGLLGLLVL